jgi:hypothetical protein
MIFGPAIPHNPHGYTAKDGTHYPAVFPYAGDTPVDVRCRDGKWINYSSADGWMWCDEPFYDVQIIAYRLPADHHAYGPKVSSKGREPDRVVNVYETWQDNLCAFEHVDRRAADFGANKQRIGIWRVYLKDKAA